MAGGGSSAGDSTPNYIKDAHDQMISGDHEVTMGNSDLTTNFMMQVMDDLIETNPSPYFGEASYVPDTDLTAGLVELTELDTEVDAMSTLTDFNTRHDNAITKGNAGFGFSSMAVDINLAVTSATAALAEAAITAAITAFRNSAEAGLATRLTQLGAGMADINAVHSSSYIVAEALIDAEVEKNISEFESQLKLTTFSDTLRSQLEVIVKKRLARDVYVVQAISEMNRLALAKLDAFKINAGMHKEYYMAKLVAKKEEKRENREMDVKDALWDMQIFQLGGNVLASISGATSTNFPEMSPVQSGVSGALSGASGGAAIGFTIGGPAGAGTGAIIGGVAGLAAGLFG